MFRLNINGMIATVPRYSRNTIILLLDKYAENMRSLTYSIRMSKLLVPIKVYLN